MNEGGWIKLHRQLLEWEWIEDPMVLAFWIQLLLTTNTQDKRRRGQTIKKGQKLTSIRNLSEDFHMAPNTVQRILRNLEESGEIKVESDKHGTIITVVNFTKYQGKGVSERVSTNDTLVDTHIDTHTDTPIDTTIRSKEYKESKKKEIDDIPTTRVREEDDFSAIENPDTQAAELVMMRMGWSRSDYQNAVRDFEATCAADGTTHETDQDLVNHFRNWTMRRYRYGEKPLQAAAPRPSTANDAAFTEFYRRTYGTEYVWQDTTTKDIERIAAAIADKIGEQGDISDPTQMPDNIRAFLEATHRLGDEWLNEHFTPAILAKQFNEIYNRIKNGNQPTATGRKGRGNPTGVSADYLASIARDLGGDL